MWAAHHAGAAGRRCRCCSSGSGIEPGERGGSGRDLRQPWRSGGRRSGGVFQCRGPAPRAVRGGGASASLGRSSPRYSSPLIPPHTGELAEPQRKLAAAAFEVAWSRFAGLVAPYLTPAQRVGPTATAVQLEEEGEGRPNPGGKPGGGTASERGMGHIGPSPCHPSSNPATAAVPPKRLQQSSSSQPRPSIIGQRQPLHHRPQSHPAEPWRDGPSTASKRREAALEYRGPAVRAPASAVAFTTPARHKGGPKKAVQKEFVFPTLYPTAPVTNGITPPKQQRRGMSKPSAKSRQRSANSNSSARLQWGGLNVALPPLGAKKKPV